MDWEPTCTNPITGTSVPKNQSQPINSHGLVLRFRQARTEMPVKIKADSTSHVREMVTGSG